MKAGSMTVIPVKSENLVRTSPGWRDVKGFVVMGLVVIMEYQT